jgi:hypothetical protein
MTALTRQVYCAVATAVFAGAGVGLVSGSAHTGIFYGTAVLTGMFAGFGLARWVR